MEHGTVTAALQADASSARLLLKQTRDESAAAVVALEQAHIAAVGNFEREHEVMRAELAAWREISVAHERDATACSQALHTSQSDCDRLAQELDVLQAAAAASRTDAGMWEACARANDELLLKLREESTRVVDEQVRMQVHACCVFGGGLGVVSVLRVFTLCNNRPSSLQSARSAHSC